MTGSVSLAGKGIHLAFGRNKVLRGVDIAAPAGKTVAVIGPSTGCQHANRCSPVSPVSGGSSISTRRP